MKIAIIGSGVSGLVAAHRLHRDHVITVFEAGDYPGGHIHTVDVEIEGERHAIDTGFIVYNERTYPRFIELLNELGVASKPTSMSFSVRDDRSGLEYNGRSLNALFTQRRNLLNPGFHRMILDILRFNREATRSIDIPPGMTVAEYLRAGRYGPEFSGSYLFPMGSAIWSCPPGEFAQFPVRFIIDFYRNHGLLSLRDRPTWRVIEGGSRTYVEAMIRPFRHRIRLSTPIRSVRRTDDEVEVTPKGAGPQPFDHVIFATHSDQALRILGEDATPTEREVLTEFPYSRNSAILHTDITTLPRSRRAWACWNYRRGEDESAPPSVTYNMNLLQGLQSRHTFCVTLNDEARIDPALVLGQYEYHHPIFTTRREIAQARHRELLDANRTSFCGAYWRYGFHEDGVVSALAVVRALEARANPRQSLEIRMGISDPVREIGDIDPVASCAAAKR